MCAHSRRIAPRVRIRSTPDKTWQECLFDGPDPARDEYVQREVVPSCKSNRLVWRWMRLLAAKEKARMPLIVARLLLLDCKTINYICLTGPTCAKATKLDFSAIRRRFRNMQYARVARLRRNARAPAR